MKRKLIEDGAIKIEKNIPYTRKPRGSMYPWAQMKVGDSFLARNKMIRSLASQKGVAQLKTGFKFACATEGNAVRVWRTA